MGFKLTIKRIQDKGESAFRSHSVLGQNGRNAGDPLQLYKEGERVSLIGAALPSRVCDWLTSEGLQAHDVKKLALAGHIEIDPEELQTIIALQKLDNARRDHVRRATGHGPALELALAGFLMEGSV